MTKKPAPTGPGPQTGAPPSLEQIPLDRLQVDPAYQRATDGKYSQRLIAAMVREWKWALCLPLVISRRAENVPGGGGLFVVDGQHRLAGARARGDIPFLPCVVQSSFNQGEEAATFIELNTKPQRLSQADIFNGRLAAGDEHAKATAVLLEQTGWRQVRSSATDGWKPGDLVCAPMLANKLRMHGRDTVAHALIALRSAYPDVVVTAPAKLLEALIIMFRPNGPLHGMEPKVVAAAMSSTRASAWMIKADVLREGEPGLGQIPALARLIIAATFPKGSNGPAALPKPPQPKSPASPAAGPSVAGEKIWCDQCDSRVSRDTAAACRNEFCKLQPAVAA